MSTCYNCGKEINDNQMNYCGFCGAPLRVAPQNTGPQNAPPPDQNINSLQTPPPPPVIVYNNQQSVTNTGTGIAALVLGLVGIFTWFLYVPAILAVIFGIIGIATKDEKHSCGCAIAGLVLGLIEAIPLIVLLVAAFH